MEPLDFLRRLLESPGTSSYEAIPAGVWRDRAEELGARVWTDAYGNSFASFGGGAGPKVMLAGHIDEIGLVITYVDDAGLLYFTGVGISDGREVMGQRVRVVSDRGQFLGVVGQKPPHLSSAEDRGKKLKLSELWIDIGARDRDDALRMVAPGDFAVFEGPVIELAGGRWASKALDNRVGAYVALEAAARAVAAGAAGEIVAVATTQEEIAGVGANVAAYALDPHLAIALDLTHASDVPNVDRKIEGEIALGKGPVLMFGSTIHQGLARRIREHAARAGIPLQQGFTGRRTATDADDIAKVRTGAPTAVISVPNRYMHSPVEVVELADIEATIRLLASFLGGLEEVSDLLPDG